MRKPLYPHVPKRKEPLFPHVPKAKVSPVTPEVTELDITKGVIKRGKELVANPDNIPAARAFIAELRRQADEAEAKALTTTESKARILNQNARQARKDADRIERTIPAIPEVKGVKFNVTPSVLEEWQMAEIASWEDAGRPKEGHAYNILSRHKSLIEVCSTKEAALLIKSAHYQGDTTGLDPSLVSKRKAIGGIGDKLIRAHGFYYSYPSFRSTKTGEVIPDPTEEPV